MLALFYYYVFFGLHGVPYINVLFEFLLMLNVVDVSFYDDDDDRDEGMVLVLILLCLLFIKTEYPNLPPTA